MYRLSLPQRRKTPERLAFRRSTELGTPSSKFGSVHFEVHRTQCTASSWSSFSSFLRNASARLRRAKFSSTGERHKQRNQVVQIGDVLPRASEVSPLRRGRFCWHSCSWPVFVPARCTMHTTEASSLDVRRNIGFTSWNQWSGAWLSCHGWNPHWEPKCKFCRTRPPSVWQQRSCCEVPWDRTPNLSTQGVRTVYVSAQKKDIAGRLNQIYRLCCPYYLPHWARRNKGKSIRKDKLPCLPPTCSDTKPRIQYFSLILSWSNIMNFGGGSQWPRALQFPSSSKIRNIKKRKT